LAPQNRSRCRSNLAKSLIPSQCDITSTPDLRAAINFITKDAGYIILLVVYSPTCSISELRKNLFDNERVPCQHNRGLPLSLCLLQLRDMGNEIALKGGFGAPLTEGGDAPSIQSQCMVTSSVAEYLREHLAPPSYVQNKTAITQLNKQISTGLWRLRTRVNALAPGCVIAARNPVTETVEDPNYTSVRRFGSRDEMDGTVLLLMERAVSFNSWMVLLLDGFSMNHPDLENMH
ncbi:hypothetical protein J1614_009679, partial [Plenodomus biglobosus]